MAASVPVTAEERQRERLLAEAIHERGTASPEGQAPGPAIQTLWVTDAELIRRSGVPEKIARQAIEMLDKNPVSGFPKKDPLWGNRRFWPAVEMYWAKRQGLVPQEVRSGSIASVSNRRGAA